MELCLSAAVLGFARPVVTARQVEVAPRVEARVIARIQAELTVGTTKILSLYMAAFLGASLLLGAGNLITADVTVERLEAFWRAAWHGVRARALASPRD